MTAPPPSPGGDVSRSHELLTVTWLFASLSSIVVSLRLYSRVKMTRNLWWDDWVMFFTVVRESQVQRPRVRKTILSDLMCGFPGPHNNLLRLLHPLCSQRRRSSCRILESISAPRNNVDQLGISNILHHGHCNRQDFRCHTHGQTYAARSMAEMGPLLFVHIHLHSSLHCHHIHLCPVLSAESALDTDGRQVLGSKENQRSRRGACKCVPIDPYGSDQRTDLK